MIRSALPLALALVVGTGSALLAQQPTAPVRRPPEPRPQIQVVDSDRPAMQLLTVLYTASLSGARHTCRAVNVSSTPVEITIELFKVGHGKVETATACRREMVAPGHGCTIIDSLMEMLNPDDMTPRNYAAYCRFSSPADRAAFRGALVTDERDWTIATPRSQNPPVSIWIPLLIRAVATAE